MGRSSLDCIVKYSTGNQNLDIDVDIEINCFHTNLIKIKTYRDVKWESDYRRCGEWIEYSENMNIEKVINDLFIAYPNEKIRCF